MVTGYSMFKPHPDGMARLRQQVRHGHLELNADAAVWLATATYSRPWPMPVRLYLHALCVEDITMQSVLQGAAPLFTSMWPNEFSPANLPALRHYAAAVHAATDAYLAELTSDGLDRIVDLARLGLGPRTLAWVIRRFVVDELARICGELSRGSRSEPDRQNPPGLAHGPGRVSAPRPGLLALS
jgi:hypothetical protein